jgi:hypothetical protein
VPIAIVLVATPHTVAAVIASTPKMFASHALAKPASSARLACAASSVKSAGRDAISPMPMPIFMSSPAGETTSVSR